MAAPSESYTDKPTNNPPPAPAPLTAHPCHAMQANMESHVINIPVFPT